MIRILLLLALPAHADTLPQSIQDPSVSEVVEYLHQEIRKEKAASANLASTNTWSQPQTFDSAVTFNSAVVNNSSVTFSGGVFGTVSRSSRTISVTDIPATSVGTDFGPCLAEISTLTLVSGAFPINIVGSLLGRTNGNGSWIDVNVLVDGDFTAPLTSSIGLCRVEAVSADSNNSAPCSFDFVTSAAVSAGSHTFCLTAKETGTSNFDCDVAACSFRVSEYK